MILPDGIKKVDAEWLLNYYQKEMHHSFLNSQRLVMHKTAQEMLRGKPVQLPDCKCHHHTFQQVGISLFEQYKSSLEELLKED
jgi:hypothetical protein